MRIKYIIGGLIVLAVALIGLGALMGSSDTWADTDVACLPNGHERLEMHFHPVLSITVDGVPEIVPANIGISPTCMAEVHTHDSSGTLHIESAESGKTFTLTDFYAVWGEDGVLERDGYDLSASIDGETYDDVSELVAVELKDGMRIQLRYTSPDYEESETEGESATTTERGIE